MDALSIRMGAAMRNSPFLKTLFIAFMLIATVYACIAAGVWLYKNNEIHNVEQNAVEKSVLQQARAQMDMKFMVALNLIQELKSNEDIIRYTADPKDYYNVTRAYNRLKKSTLAFNNFGYKIDIMEEHSGLVVTPNKTIDNASYYAEMGFPSDQLKEIEQFVAGKSKADVLFLRHQIADPEAMPIGNSFTIVKKETVDYTSKLVFIVTFAEQLFFTGWQTTDAQGIGFILNKDLMLAKSGLSEKDMSVQLSSSPTIGESSSYLKTETSDFRIHTLGSAVFDEIVYFYMTPKYPWLEKIKLLFWEAGLVYMVLLLLGIGAAVFFSNKVYKPVRHIVSSIWKQSGTNGRDEFKLIGDTISALQSTNDRLQEKVLQNDKVLKGTFLRDVAYGSVFEEKLSEGLRTYSLEWLEQGGSIVIIKWTSDDLHMRLNKAEQAVVELRVANLIKELVTDRLEWIEYRAGSYIFFIGELEPSIIKKNFSQIVYSMDQEFGISMLVSIGKSASTVQEWELSYVSASSLLEDQIALDRQSILTFDDQKPVHAAHYYYPLELERDLIYMVIQRKKDQLGAIVSRIVQENVERRNIGRDLMEQLLHSIANTVGRIVHQLNETEERLFGQGVSSLKVLRRREAGGDDPRAVFNDCRPHPAKARRAG
jgi:two-component system response regulator YesN